MKRIISALRRLSARLTPPTLSARMTLSALPILRRLSALPRLLVLSFSLTLALALILASLSFSSPGETIRMAVTTSFVNSGLAERLLPAMEKDTGVSALLLAVGTGRALALGAAGDVDALLIHSKPAEEQWIAEGYGIYRREIMYNDFLVIGPSDDPAGVRDSSSAADALSSIARTRSAFVSRGDDSGTHKKELALWEIAGIEPSGGWYRSVGQGMGAALNTASAMQAYVLSDRASWLNFGNKGELKLLFEGDPELFNQYAWLPVNPERHAHVRFAAARKVEEWLVSDKARELIDGYRVAGGRPFRFNAD